MRVELAVVWGEDEEGRDIGLTATTEEIPEGAPAAEARMVLDMAVRTMLEGLKDRGKVQREPGEPGTPEWDQELAAVGLAPDGSPLEGSGA